MPEAAEPLIVPLWPDCEVPLVLPVPVEGVLPAVPAPVPVVDPLPLVVPAPVVGVGEVLPVVLPAPVLPLLGIPDSAPRFNEALVNIHVLPEPMRHPVTVTVPALVLLAAVEV